MSIFKFLKIALPLSTATSATIVTTFLISSFNKEKIQLNFDENLDIQLNDFEFPDEIFKETKKIYEKDANETQKKSLDPEIKEKVVGMLEKIDELKKSKPEKLKEAIEELEKEIGEIFSDRDRSSKNKKIEIDSPEGKSKGDIAKGKLNELQEESGLLIPKEETSVQNHNHEAEASKTQELLGKESLTSLPENSSNAIESFSNPETKSIKGEQEESEHLERGSFDSSSSDVKEEEFHDTVVSSVEEGKGDSELPVTKALEDFDQNIEQTRNENQGKIPNNFSDTVSYQEKEVDEKKIIMTPEQIEELKKYEDMLSFASKSLGKYLNS